MKEKVAILGGGPAGIAAAFHLTETEALRERFDVTVYTLGWRLGGKCASGRDLRSGRRIHEHGLHIWFGFYDNSFALMDACWEALGRDPVAERERWFTPCDTLVLYDRRDSGWKAREFTFARGDGEIGLSDVLTQLGSMLKSVWRQITDDDDDDRRVRTADELATEATGHEPLDPRLDAALGDVKRDLKERLDDADDPDDDLLYLTEAWDLGSALLRGLIVDRVQSRGVDRLNQMDFSEWLIKHGCDESTAFEAPIVRALYDLVFGYVDGDKHQPDLAAGKALQALIRIVFGYRGAIVNKMNSGMGDTIFTPLFDALTERGVKFEFFRRVVDLIPADDGKVVDAIELVRQAEVRNGDYDPFLPGDHRHWPSEPIWDRLVASDELRRHDLERGEPAGSPRHRLERGTDFDSIVLAIPVQPLQTICRRLAERDEPLRRMLDNSDTVATQALQLWLTRPADADGEPSLGWRHGALSVASAFEAPFDTYSNMDQLIAEEESPARHIAYFCGVLREGDRDQAEADLSVLRGARRFLRDAIHTLWPGHPEFGWDTLVAPDGLTGEDRLAAQFWRANVNGGDRYTATRAGAVHHRLAAHESGFDNLVLAGDWTRNGIDGGAVEAAVTSGLQAARTLRGDDPEATPGMQGWLAADGFRRDD